MEVGLDRVARQRLEGRSSPATRAAPSRPWDTRCPSSPNSGRRTPSGSDAPQSALHQVQAVAAVAAEALVAAVARQRDGDVLARELAHAVGRNRRAVGIRLVVDAGELSIRSKSSLSTRSTKCRCDSARRPAREGGLVERRVGERDRAGVDRVRRTGQPWSRRRRWNRRRPDRNAPSGTSEIMRSLTDSAQALRRARAGLVLGDRLLAA